MTKNKLNRKINWVQNNEKKSIIEWNSQTDRKLEVFFRNLFLFSLFLCVTISSRNFNVYFSKIFWQFFSLFLFQDVRTLFLQSSHTPTDTPTPTHPPTSQWILTQDKICHHLSKFSFFSYFISSNNIKKYESVFYISNQKNII